jgi:hypothetical protein
VSGKQSQGRDGDIDRQLDRGRKNAAKTIKFSRLDGENKEQLPPGAVIWRGLHSRTSYRRLSCGPKSSHASDSYHCRPAHLGWHCQRHQMPVITPSFQQRPMGLAPDR